MWKANENESLKHPVNLSGMTVGDFFYFCDECGYQHKANFVISGRCPECRPTHTPNMLQCTVTEEDRSIWNSAIKAAANATGEPDSMFELLLVKPKP